MRLGAVDIAISCIFVFEHVRGPRLAGFPERVPDVVISKNTSIISAVYLEFSRLSWKERGLGKLFFFIQEAANHHR
jgi:hypothetical protein